MRTLTTFERDILAVLKSNSHMTFYIAGMLQNQTTATITTKQVRVALGQLKRLGLVENVESPYKRQLKWKVVTNGKRKSKSISKA